MFLSKYLEGKAVRCKVSWSVIQTAGVKDLLRLHARVGVVKWSNLLRTLLTALQGKAVMVLLCFGSAEI